MLINNQKSEVEYVAKLKFMELEKERIKKELGSQIITLEDKC